LAPWALHVGRLVIVVVVIFVVVVVVTDRESPTAADT
jgi:hypothetical protein